MTNTKELINVYDTGTFVGRIKNDTKEIANLVASASPCTNYVLVDTHTDNLILTTIGFFLNDVVNQDWLNSELLPKLIPLQTGEDDIEEVNFL